MNDSKAALAAAVAGGYLMGRTKKAKLAFAVGSYLMGRRIGLSPGQVLSQGLSGIQRNPQLQELTDQVRGELLTASRTAVTAAANRTLTGLADNLRDRTDALTGAGRSDDGYADDETDEGGPDEDAYFDEEEREEARRPAPPRKTTAEKAAKKTAKKVPPRKTAPPVKTAEGMKKAAKKTAPAKRTANPGRHGGERG
ncbi:hypothetical protein EF919_32475 [Streptomyces sp. WAC02707]|uniref:hypothetical protein n=1 Tax=Streptomyces sp. WAC02707 TaxID=2487417 RepID=UPI000F781845|nr:hypothetical protein [Streptomyces sp. WAC02707]RSS87969.1 hypothetical protein EF919_32475 [Streptomyces sp. WAC02707]